MIAHAHEDDGSVGLRSVFDPVLALGFLDDCSLFGDCLGIPFEDYDAMTVTKMPPTPNHAADHADAQVFVDTALADVFDDSFGLFDLELDFVCSSASVTLEQAPEFSLPLDLSYKAPEPLLHEDFEIREPFLKKTKKTSKTSSQRQREEIASLRVTAARLEQELQRMKTVSRQAPPSIKEERAEDDDGSALLLASLWEAVAKRQDAEKLRAEQENVHLKQQLKDNVAIAKSLERSLLKRKFREL